MFLIFLLFLAYIQLKYNFFKKYKISYFVFVLIWIIYIRIYKKKIKTKAFFSTKKIGSGVLVIEKDNKCFSMQFEVVITVFLDER